MTEDIKVAVEDLEERDQDEESRDDLSQTSPDNVIFKKKKPKKQKVGVRKVVTTNK